MLPVKPKIFVSSTIQDLPLERDAALKAIKTLNGIPRMSEKTIEATNKDSIKTCVDEVKACDFFILILGNRYGWCLPNGISITELEFDTAFKEKKTIFVFNTILEKEQKQKEFEKKVGNLFFWKIVTDPSDLEIQIRSAIQRYYDDYKYQQKVKTEKQQLNLVEIFLPETIFIGDIKVDRKSIIELSRTTDKKLTQKATWEEVIKKSLEFENKRFSNDWIVREKKIITFHNLRNPNIPLSSIVDTGTIEEFETVDYSDINSDYLNNIKSLSSKCLQKQLFYKGVSWQHETKSFIFIPEEDGQLKRQIEWHGKVDATRTVYEVKFKKTKPNEVLYHKHFAFRTKIHFLNGQFYLEINPDWFFSFNGYSTSYYNKDSVTYLKKNEHNNNLKQHFNFLIHFLVQTIKPSIFNDSASLKIDQIKFGETLFIESYPSFDDEKWKTNEDSDEIEKFIKNQNNRLF